jgi:HlyD family secretion protein
MPRPPRDTSSGQRRDVGIGRGSAQQAYVLDADGQPRAVPVTTGDSNGNLTEVNGAELREGALVITGQLAGEARQGATSSTR